MICTGLAVAGTGVTTLKLKGKNTYLTEKQLAALESQLRKELDGIPAKFYHVEIRHANGKTAKLGTAKLKDLKNVHVISPKFNPGQAVNEILRTVGEYITVIVSSDVPANLKDRVVRVETLLYRSGYTLNENALKLTDTQLTSLQTKLKKELEGIPAKYYHLEVKQGGAKAVKLGTAKLGDLHNLRVVSPNAASSNVADEIVRTVGDYITVVWTDNLPANLADRKAKVEQLLSIAK